MKITIEVDKEGGTIGVTSDEPVSLRVTTKILISLAENCVHLLDTEGNKDINEIGKHKDRSKKF